MKKIFALIFLFVALLNAGCGGEEEVATKTPVKQEIKVPADSLQELFIQITPKTTKEEIEAYAVANGLYLNKDRFDYKLAVKESDARFKHNTGGDSVTVVFNKDWTLEYGEYYYGETMKHAFIIPDGSIDAPARYSYTESASYDRKTATAALTALAKVVSE